MARECKHPTIRVTGSPRIDESPGYRAVWEWLLAPVGHTTLTVVFVEWPCLPADVIWRVRATGANGYRERG
jgi:hypothetical protein